MRILTVYSLTYWTLRVALLPVTIVGPRPVHLGGAPTLGYEGLLRGEWWSFTVIRLSRDRG